MPSWQSHPSKMLSGSFRKEQGLDGESMQGMVRKKVEEGESQGKEELGADSV